MTDRRQVLQMAVVAAVGCIALPSCDSLPVPTPADPTPDAQQSAELALIATYDAAIATAGPRRGEVLRQIRDQHVQHVRALGWTRDLPAATPSSKPVPTAALLAEERRALRRHTDGARTTTDAERAQVLALIAASEAQHIVSLESQ